MSHVKCGPKGGDEAQLHEHVLWLEGRRLSTEQPFPGHWASFLPLLVMRCAGL